MPQGPGVPWEHRRKPKREPASEILSAAEGSAVRDRAVLNGPQHHGRRVITRVSPSLKSGELKAEKKHHGAAAFVSLRCPQGQGKDSSAIGVFRCSQPALAVLFS